MSGDAPTRVERKYTFPDSLGDAVLAWLEHRCIPDPAHPGGVVSTIYYDTPALASYGEKREGDYLKCKLRLRWYGEPEAEAEDEASCFLEAKRREGRAGGKSRVPVRLPVPALAGTPLEDERIAALVSRAAELGVRPPGPLVPMALVRYLRRRFVEPETGARLSVDTRIRCEALNGDFLVGSVPADLDVGVLEIKEAARGAGGSGARALGALGGLLVPASISKYARCLDRARRRAGRSDRG